MNLLYKYYSNKSLYAFENVENGNICFSPLESLNDPFEGIGKDLYGISDDERIFWEAIGIDFDKLISRRISEDLRDNLNFKYRVFCASKEYDNCLLWAYYANSHKGFCVGYKESSIFKVSDELLDVEYSSEMYPINGFDENKYKKLLSLKSLEWSSENERRAIYVLKDNEIEALDSEVFYDKKKQNEKKMYKLYGRDQANNSKTLCAERFILKECQPSVIYLGLRMDLKDKQRLINFARKYNIKVYQMSQEQNSFKFIPREIYTGN